MERNKRKLLALFCLFIWFTVVFVRSKSLGPDLAYDVERIVAIIITFGALTTFGVAVGRLWDEDRDDD